MKKIGIYKIQSIIKPERIYIGSSKDIRVRWEIYRSKLKLNKYQFPEVHLKKDTYLGIVDKR